MSAEEAVAEAVTGESPPIVAYTADVSICSQICRLAIHEHGLACEHVNVDIECRMQNCEPWFIRIQPKMTVPAMKYGEMVVGDSKDILYFLAERHPGLYPAATPERTAIDDFISEFYGRFGLIAAFTFGHLVRTNSAVKDFIRKGKTDVSRSKLEQVVRGSDPGLANLAQVKLQRIQAFDMVAWAESQDVNALCKKMGALLDAMEATLATGQPFLVGDSYSLADIVATAFCARVHFIKGEALFGPNVSAYWGRMQERPSFKQAYICATWEDALMSKQVDAAARGEDALAVEWARPHVSR